MEAVPIACALRQEEASLMRNHAWLRTAAAPIACARARRKPASRGHTSEPAHSRRRSPATAAGGSWPREDARLSPCSRLAKQEPRRAFRSLVGRKPRPSPCSGHDDHARVAEGRPTIGLYILLKNITVSSYRIFLLQLKLSNSPYLIISLHETTVFGK